MALLIVWPLIALVVAVERHRHLLGSQPEILLRSSLLSSTAQSCSRVKCRTRLERVSSSSRSAIVNISIADSIAEAGGRLKEGEVSFWFMLFGFGAIGEQLN